MRILIFIIITALMVTGLTYVLWGGESNQAPQVYTQPETTPMQDDIISQKLRMSPPEAMMLVPGKNYVAVLKTSAGEIDIKLYGDKVPATVNNFVYLTKAGFYNDTVFHRAMKGFMIQGGDPKGDGTGGPNYRFPDEQFAGEYKRGVVAMANAGPDTNGSQFFIMHADYPLQPNYVIFGEVINGMDAVDAIAEAPVRESPSGEMSRPIEPVVVQTVDIIIEE
jgi:cyclophilin family peptidyl-prolyl cis-trans isomerase